MHYTLIPEALKERQSKRKMKEPGIKSIVNLTSILDEVEIDEVQNLNLGYRALFL
jgi:hypothetical protein